MYNDKQGILLKDRNNTFETCRSNDQPDEQDQCTKDGEGFPAGLDACIDIGRCQGFAAILVDEWIIDRFAIICPWSGYCDTEYGCHGCFRPAGIQRAMLANHP